MATGLRANRSPQTLIDDSCVLPMPGIFVLEARRAMRVPQMEPDYTQRLEPSGLPTPLVLVSALALLRDSRALLMYGGFLNMATRLNTAQTDRGCSPASR